MTYKLFMQKTGFSRILAGGTWKRRRITFADFVYQIWKVFDTGIQGGSDISGTLSKLHCHIKKIFFWTILLPQTVSAVCRSINKNKNKHSRKDKSKGSYKSRDSLQTLRRTYHEIDAELAQGEPYGGVGRGSLASQLAWLQAFWLCGVSELWVKAKSRNKSKDLI